MDQKIIGNFYYKLTSNGNLLGEFTNQLNQDIYSESADLIQQGSVEFEGDYRSTWFESNDAQLLELRIKAKQPLHFRKYELEWVDEADTNKIIFQGEGFVVDGLLIGYFTDYKK